MNRSLALSAKATRELEAAIDEVVAGKFQRAVERLAGMLGWRHTPEVQKVRRVEVVQPRSSGEHPALERLRESPPATITVQGHEYALAPRTVTPLPKPQKRVVDRDLLDAFREQFPTCAVRGCGRDADPHHLVKRSEGGSDAHENLLALCVHHHTGRQGWHALTPDVWVPKYSARLGVVERCKIRLALETVAARKGTDDGARDQDG